MRRPGHDIPMGLCWEEQPNEGSLWCWCAWSAAHEQYVGPGEPLTSAWRRLPSSWSSGPGGYGWRAATPTPLALRCSRLAFALVSCTPVLPNQARALIAPRYAS